MAAHVSGQISWHDKSLNVFGAKSSMIGGTPLARVRLNRLIELNKFSYLMVRWHSTKDLLDKIRDALARAIVLVSNQRSDCREQIKLAVLTVNR